MRALLAVFSLLFVFSASLHATLPPPCPPLILGETIQLPPPLRNATVASRQPIPLRSPKAPRFARGFAAPQPAAVLEYLLQIDSRADFDSLAKAVRAAGRLQKSVKLVYHRGAPQGPALYFIHTDRYPYHYEFATAVLGFSQPPEAFNLNYQGSGETREYNLGTLVLKETEKGPELMLELWNGDTLSAKHTAELYSAVKAKLGWGVEVFFHPLSVDQERMAVSLEMPVRSTEQLYGDQTYMAWNEGTAYGYLRLVDPKDPNPLLDLTDIPVFAQVPNEIGLVGGVITEEMQTPLSHVNVKSTNRRTPNMSLRKAREVLKKYNSKPVQLTVGPNGYEVKEIPEAEAQQHIAEFWAERKPKLKSKPESFEDPRYKDSFVPLYNHYTAMPDPAAHRQLIRTVGAKAANLGVLNWLTREMPPGMRLTSPLTVAVPFSFWDQFLDQKTAGGQTLLTQVINALNSGDLLNEKAAHPIGVVRPVLEKVRAQILAAKVPEKMIALCKRAFWDDPLSPLHFSKSPIVLLRSSTNSEDLDGFTGAGLYNSTSLRFYEVEKGRLRLRHWEDVEADLRKKIPYIYSSVWNERAFLEREWFSMTGDQHLAIKAGIAMHGGFTGTLIEGPVGESANGVAITGNIFNSLDMEKIYINGQHYSLSVTNPPTEEELRKWDEKRREDYRTEQILVTTFLANYEESQLPGAWRAWPFERLQTSSVRNGSPVFQNDQETRRLAWGLRQVKYALAHVLERDPQTFVADVEWNIFGRNRTISLNQARPFQVARP